VSHEFGLEIVWLVNLFSEMNEMVLEIINSQLM